MALFDPKAKNIAMYQKSIDEKKVSIGRYFDEIGRFYYKQYVDINVDNTKDINTRCEAITRLSKEINELNVKILYEKGLKLCPMCRTENELRHSFCFKCGASFAAAATTAATTDDVVVEAPAVEEAPAAEAAPVAEAAVEEVAPEEAPVEE